MVHGQTSIVLCRYTLLNNNKQFLNLSFALQHIVLGMTLSGEDTAMEKLCLHVHLRTPQPEGACTRYTEE